MPDIKPDIAQLRTDTTVAAAKANAAEMLSKADFKDMTDGTVSSKDLTIAKGWVSVLSGYLDEGSLSNRLTKLGLTRLPSDLSRARAEEMLAAANEMHAAVSDQLAAQGFSRTLLEEAKDEFRTPVRFVKAVRDFLGSSDQE